MVWTGHEQEAEEMAQAVAQVGAQGNSIDEGSEAG